MNMEKTFRDWMALAYPWVAPESPIWSRQRIAFEAGYKAAERDADNA